MTSNNQKLLDQIDVQEIQYLTMCAIVGSTEVDFDHVQVADISDKMVAMLIEFKEKNNPITYRLVVKIIDIGDFSVIRNCELYQKESAEEYKPLDIAIDIFNYIIKRGLPWSPTPSNPISEYLLKNRL